MRITALHVHPIKGCHRIEVPSAVVTPYGFAGDREWQLVAADGTFVTQRTQPRLATVHPALAEGGVLLQAEGMPELFVERPARADRSTTTYSGPVQVGDAGDAAAAWFTRLLGEEVRLVGLAPGYVRATGMFATESNLGDVAPILVANDASHEFLAERAAEPFGIDRWRANVWISGAEPWVEDTWRRLAIGDVTVTLVVPWPRCAVPQVDQDDGSRRREPAVVLKAHRWCSSLPDDASPVEKMMMLNQSLFGMGGAIEPAGAVVSVGDEVAVVETGPALL